MWDLHGHEELQKKFCGDCHTPQSLGVKPTEDATKTQQQTAEALAKKIDDLILQKSKKARSGRRCRIHPPCVVGRPGHVPPKDEIEKFVENDDPQKREKLLYEKWLKSHHGANNQRASHAARHRMRHSTSGFKT